MRGVREGEGDGEVMARIRTLKPEILEDEKAAGLSDSAFRLFMALIVLADDYGNVRADARWLEGQVWWARRDPPHLAAIRRELAEASLIELYEVRGQTYCHIRSWEKHQRIDNAGKPRVPKPCEGSPFSAEICGEIPRNSAGPRPPTTDHESPEPDPSGKPDSPSQVEIPVPLQTDAEILAETAVREINRLGGTRYKADSKDTSDNCKALAKAKRTPEQIVAVVASKAREWIGNPKMQGQLKPSVILRPSNFAKYLEDIEARSGSRVSAQDSTGEHRVYQAGPVPEYEPELLRLMSESGDLDEEPDAVS